MPHFTPTRPPSTRLLIPLPPELHDANQTLTASLSLRPPPAEAARLTVQALNLAVPSKAKALEGFLRTLDTNQRTAVVARNTLEEAATVEHAALAGARPTRNPAQWRSKGATLILKASPKLPQEDLSSALYLIFLGRPLRMKTLQRLEAMAAVNGPQAPPHIVHLIASPSLDSRAADILLAKEANGQPSTGRNTLS